MGCAGHGIILIYVVKYAIDSEVFTGPNSLATAGIILTIISLVSIVSRFGTPVLAEIYGTRRMMAVSLAIQGITVPIIMFGPAEPWLFYLFAVSFGIGFGGEWTGYLIINRQYFGDGPMGTVYGWQTTGALMGHFIATALAGLIMYTTGSYMAVLGLSMAYSLGGVVVIALLDNNSQLRTSARRGPPDTPTGKRELPDEARLAPRQAQGACHCPRPPFILGLYRLSEGRVGAYRFPGTGGITFVESAPISQPELGGLPLMTPRTP